MAGNGSARGEVAVTGASGLVGRALLPLLQEAGYMPRPLVRRVPRSGSREIGWDPAHGQIDASALEGVGAVVHLAGRGLAEGRWTPEVKREIRESRVQGTRLLSETLARLRQPPRVLVSASAVGYYGSHPDALRTEESPPAHDFLGEICQEWEAATRPAEDAGIRVVHYRIGVVLAREGGALAQMLPIFRAGLGGPLAGGAHWWSCISRTDLCRAIQFLLETEDVAGAVNGVGPRPVTNAEFTRTLGKVLHRPAVLPVPEFALRLVFGEMADAVLASTRVAPRRLEEAGFRFQHLEVEEMLRVELSPRS